MVCESWILLVPRGQLHLLPPLPTGSLTFNNVARPKAEIITAADLSFVSKRRPVFRGQEETKFLALGL